MKEKAPLPLAVVVPKEVPPLKTSTVLPASALPVIAGVVSLVVVDVVVNDDGALGITVSTLRVKVLLLSDPSALLLPAASENLEEATLISPLVVLSAVGVNVAV